MKSRQSWAELYACEVDRAADAPVFRQIYLQLRSAIGFVDVTAQSDERPFNLGRTLVDARTAELWRKLSARTLRSFGRHHLGYGDPHGMLELRKSVCDYLQAARGVRCEPEQVVITAGTQQAVDIVTRVMQGPDKEVWIEDPGYSLTRLALVAAGAKVCPIPVDQHGVNVTEGIRRAPKARAVFITSSHQFPKGVALSMARRLELLAWARESGAWIVEDDYASEFRYGGRPLASLQGLDEAERVIYIGTLNKALFPGLRLGYAVVPPSLVRAFVTARYLTASHRAFAKRSSPPSWKRDTSQLTSAECGRCTATSGTSWSPRSGAAWATT